MAAIPNKDLAFLRRYIHSQKWREAKTFKSSFPHEYVVRAHFKNSANKLQMYDRFIQLIWTYGHIENFHHHGPNAYLIVDDCKYWRIDNGPHDKVLNRTHTPNETFGKQWTSRTRSNRKATEWDVKSYQYSPDQELSTKTLRKLQKTRRDQLRILDVGCGTGRLLDQIQFSPKLYGGIDPSSGMLNQFLVKHPAYKVRPQTAEEYLTGSVKRWNVGAVLGGTASLLSDIEWDLLTAAVDEIVID